MSLYYVVHVLSIAATHSTKFMMSDNYSQHGGDDLSLGHNSNVVAGRMLPVYTHTPPANTYS